LIERAHNRIHNAALIWFGVFDAPERVTQDAVTSLLPAGEGAWISAARPRMTREAYEAAFARARRYIEAGDIYQVNLSFRTDVTILGDALAAYSQLRTAGGGGWSGVASNGDVQLLTTSPELFFRFDGRTLEARPMKGTAKRHADATKDREVAAALALDMKERAENLMIVDLLRNDISRIAQVGKVTVPALFSVETYPTVHTLTSTVRGEIKPGRDALDALGALFPCGSITGAPKIRAMEIIDELEIDERGPYTGAIGWMGPDGTAEFNVAIRTVVVTPNGAELGLGSAVIYDSVAEKEWDECLLKGAFLTANRKPLDLIETMGFSPATGIALLDLHLARLRKSAHTFGFPFDAGSIRARLDEVLANAPAECVVRLTLGEAGGAVVTLRDMPPPPSGPASVVLTPLPVASSDFRLRHKTTDRAFYDQARAAESAYEVIFVDEAGFLTEGTFTNIFVERDGVLLTPPESRGLLSGVLRASLLASGKAQEKDLREADLQNGFFVGNAVRGLIPARLDARPRPAP
jgi:para-aminobenzoate synthetase/4-amino-4-deoxychorismate lyase